MDLIERRDVLGLPRNITKNFFGEVIEETINVEDIKALPSKQPQRMRGRWNGYNADNPVWLRNDGAPIFLVCSECHGTVINNGSALWNYYPSCGADMREGQDGENM